MLPVLIASHDIIACGTIGLLSAGIIIPTVTVLAVLCVAAMTMLSVIVTAVLCWKIHKTPKKGIKKHNLCSA